ncbi:MAG: DUF3881 family protein [Lachnospiraceae bacterium]|jgi:hypothetical protein|nr:DUF3881 family protein [Lachnospiraceae bacterium]MDD7048959.1 DUF3881 family protein [Lachnospiraceae bacterium]
MHSFLGSVGFSKLSDLEDQDKLLQDVLTHFDYKNISVNEYGRTFAEISKEFAEDCGITVCGEYDRNKLFHFEYYYPYFWGSQITSYESVSVNKHLSDESYAAACDDLRTGTTLIFYLTNTAEYFRISKDRKDGDLQTSVSVSALAKSGSVLLPVVPEQKPHALDPRELEEKNDLVEAAQNGDEDAIESLTMEDMDTYTMLSRRVRHEDVYTIVNTYLMPYGMECDLYNIMGEINAFKTVRNYVTGEKLYQISILCNEIPMDVCINEKDLEGEPEVGRRFKAIVWLQGKINAG